MFWWAEIWTFKDFRISNKTFNHPQAVPFSEQEVANLCLGVQLYGRSWSLIIARFQFHSSRTPAQLRRKYSRIKVTHLIYLQNYLCNRNGAWKWIDLSCYPTAIWGAWRYLLDLDNTFNCLGYKNYCIVALAVKWIISNFRSFWMKEKQASLVGAHLIVRPLKRCACKL